MSDHDCLLHLEPMRDYHFRGRVLRVFWRGWSHPLRPYAWRDYGLVAFGALCVGFMFWPQEEEAIAPCSRIRQHGGTHNGIESHTPAGGAR